jgi:hypothetical protein
MESELPEIKSNQASKRDGTFKKSVYVIYECPQSGNDTGSLYNRKYLSFGQHFSTS